MKLSRTKLIVIICIIFVCVAFLGLWLSSPMLIHAVKYRLLSVKHTISKIIPTTEPNSTSKGTTSGSLISRNIPVFASSELYPASGANDDSYDSTWRSNGSPAWLAYDLSSVPVAKRSKVLVAWYNETGNYDHTLIGLAAYNVPQNYTIDVNAAAGQNSPPTTGWVSLVNVRNNHYHSRQHLLDMKSYNWLRITITAVDGSVENYDSSINMDVYDASTALDDDWIFFGDSITAGAMGHQTLNGTVSFEQLINAQSAKNYPVQESGGTAYLTSSDGVKYLNTWLSLFPGKYVGLSYGTNDALGCVNSATFYNNYATMVQAVLNVGKVPVIPFIPWGRSSAIQQCAPALNAQIAKLYNAFPAIIHGPDLWSFFQSHQNLISDDNIHPTNDGFAAYRQQWANVMLMQIYHHNP